MNSRGRKEREPRRLADDGRAPEVSRSYELGDDTDERLRKAVAILLRDDEREGSGRAA